MFFKKFLNYHKKKLWTLYIKCSFKDVLLSYKKNCAMRNSKGYILIIQYLDWISSVDQQIVTVIELYLCI